ncbi:MAG: CRTAC1 family protein [bacterium]|nr:CRTAC1 family protein [bacterium]
MKSRDPLVPMHGLPSRHGKSKLVVILAGLVLLAGMLVFFSVQNAQKPGEVENAEQAAGSDSGQSASDASDGQKLSPAEALELAVKTVSNAEDADYEVALDGWRTLVRNFPDDSVYKINEAVTVLKWIDETNNRLAGGTMEDAAERAKLESELEEAYATADAIIQRLTEVDQGEERAALLQAALLEAKALRAEYPQDEQFRKDAAKILASALETDRAQPILACKLDDLVQTLPPEDEQLIQQNVEALYASWKARPRNLLLLTRAMETLWGTQDPRLAELLEPSLEVTRPLWSEVARSIDSLKPEEFLPRVQQAIEAGDWTSRDVRRLPLWVNVIKGMSSAFRSDYRLVKPDIMALLDTSFLNDLSQQASKGELSDASPLDFESAALNPASSIVAWFDYDLDLDFELVSVDGNRLQLFEIDEGVLQSSPVQELELGVRVTGMLVAEFFGVDDPDRNRLPETVEDAAQQAGFSTESMDDASKSSRHDTYQELLAWGPDGLTFIQVRNDAAAGLQLAEMQAESGLEDQPSIEAAVALDMESDGDLDLVLAAAGEIKVFQNNGNRTFEDVTQYSMVGAPDPNQKLGSFHRLIACDLDNDLDQDVVGVASQGNQPVFFENILHGQFRLRFLSGEGWPVYSETRDLAVAEIDGNSSWDLAICDSTQLVLATTRTPKPGELLPMTNLNLDASAQRIQIGDFNNDSYLDVVLGTREGVRALRGTAVGWSDLQQIDGSNQEVTQLVAMDCNQDGALDIALVEGGRAKVLLGVPTDEMYLSARVRGINDVNGGGRINHFSVGSTIELWSGGRQQRRFIDAATTHFGLGDQRPENLRVVFTNGLTQNLLDPPVNTLVEERQELKGSCPFVYGWNGERFELITDLLWNAPLGLQLSRGELMPDRRWENLLLPGGLMQPKGDGYELRVTEELWEVAYFDHIQLTAVDHPAGTRLFTNEKVGPPHLAEHQLFLVSQAQYPQRARDTYGRDKRSEVSNGDQVYAQGFDRLLCQGLAEPHFLELDFGQLDTQRDLRLFLTGWMHPTDTSLNIGISQNPQQSPPQPPSLWVVDGQGDWQCALPFMGFPGGKPKSIVVDLQGIFRSDDHRIRIASSQQIYWDEAFIAYDSKPVPIEQSELTLQTAELHFRGFSRLSKVAPDQPHWYDYQSVSKTPKWPGLEGPFSRYGDVSALLVSDDDRMVVMSPGDEIRLRFEVPEKQMPNGWVRDFVLHCVGWDKDADLNTICGQGSLPLPFTQQASYPPPPEQSEISDRVRALNQEQLTRFPDRVGFVDDSRQSE